MVVELEVVEIVAVDVEVTVADVDKVTLVVLLRGTGGRRLFSQRPAEARTWWC